MSQANQSTSGSNKVNSNEGSWGPILIIGVILWGVFGNHSSKPRPVSGPVHSAPMIWSGDRDSSSSSDYRPSTYRVKSSAELNAAAKRTAAPRDTRSGWEIRNGK
jgi:hypothetical protein